MFVSLQYDMSCLQVCRDNRRNRILAVWLDPCRFDPH